MPRDRSQSRVDAMYRGLSEGERAPPPRQHPGPRLQQPPEHQPPPKPVPPPHDRPKRKLSDLQVLIGGGVVVAAGLALGLWARPSLYPAESGPATHPEAPAPRLEVAQLPAPPPPAAPTDKLEVLSAEAATAAAAPPQVAAEAAPETAPPAPEPVPAARVPAPRGPEPRSRMAALTPPSSLAAPATAAPGLVAPAQASPSTRGLDCAAAGALADQMVCADAGLAAADREMTRAYRRALRVADSPAALRADQRDWLAIREEAAHRSRRALAQVYRQRIDELNDAAAPEEDDEEPDEGY